MLSGWTTDFVEQFFSLLSKQHRNSVTMLSQHALEQNFLIFSVVLLISLAWTINLTTVSNFSFSNGLVATVVHAQIAEAVSHRWGPSAPSPWRAPGSGPRCGLRRIRRGVSSGSMVTSCHVNSSKSVISQNITGCSKSHLYNY